MSLNPPIKDWHERVVWVVGASSGIGRATASLLHAQGARVVVSARSAPALRDFVAGHAGSEAEAFDVVCPGEAAAALQRLLARHGRLDMLLYCAGHYKPLRAQAFDLDEMLRHQDVNYVGALRVLAEVLPPLVKQGQGHISLVGSVAGYRGLPNALAYGPTKAALHHLAEALHLDLRPGGIGVSVVNPGFVATALTADNGFAMPALLTPEQAARQMLRGWARGRFEIHFPKRFTLWLQLLRLLPHALYFPAVRRFTGT